MLSGVFVFDWIFLVFMLLVSLSIFRLVGVILIMLRLVMIRLIMLMFVSGRLYLLRILC